MRLFQETASALASVLPAYYFALPFNFLFSSRALLDFSSLTHHRADSVHAAAAHQGLKAAHRAARKGLEHTAAPLESLYQTGYIILVGP